MKVSELIAKLQTLQQDAVIATTEMWLSEGFDSNSVVRVDEIRVTEAQVEEDPSLVLGALELYTLW